MDEQALVVNLGEKGLVIISGCSHPGIVNTIQYAQENTGNSRIYAVIGGLHLAQVGDEVLTQTINGIKDCGAQLALTGHCTGFPPRHPYESGTGQHLCDQLCGIDSYP